MASRDYGPGEVTGMGEAIYEEQSRTRIGTVEKATYVVIDIETGDYEIDPRDSAATRRLLERNPDAATNWVRVGRRAAYRHVGGSGCLNAVIRGRVRGSQQALIAVEIIDRNGHPRSVDVVVDTGFTGYLTLPPESISQLGLPSLGQRTLEPANGEIFDFQVYLGSGVVARSPKRCSGAAIRQRLAAGYGPALG